MKSGVAVVLGVIFALVVGIIVLIVVSLKTLQSDESKSYLKKFQGSFKGLGTFCRTQSTMSTDFH